MIKKTIQQLLSFSGYRLIQERHFETLMAKGVRADDLEFCLALGPENLENRLNNLKFSNAQLRQDLFALNQVDFKHNGFFVEFGATNGITLSNTYLLEKRFGWTGILAEPASVWHNELESNRNCIIEKDCVWHTSGERLVFNEVVDHKYSGELSTINDFSNADGHSSARRRGKKYNVKTVSLEDLLLKHNAPFSIDYLSIDTEGSEFEILSSFDFNKFDIKVITCEHNYTSRRDDIYKLMVKNGYERRYTELSKFDDWYVRI